MKESLLNLYKKLTGCSPDSVEPLTAAGSPRRYYRMVSEYATNVQMRSLIGVSGTSVQENCAFFELTSHFEKSSLPVPHVYAISQDRMSYIIQDLGSTLLYDMLSVCRQNNEYDGEYLSVLEECMRLLVRFQYRGSNFDSRKFYPAQRFDRTSIKFDLNYFKYMFLKGIGIEINDNLLEDEFDSMLDLLYGKGKDLDNSVRTIMLRDFQSRNVMITPAGPAFIDYQGARTGPVEYDLASFLWQGRAAFPENLKKHLLDVYFAQLSEFDTVERSDFDRRVKVCVLLRTLQTLGAYGYRGIIQGKQMFVVSIAPALRQLKALLCDQMFDFPYLKRLLSELPAEWNAVPSTDNKLTVRIYSFSYRRGIPQDITGNGGGFVFDCRFMHNPGLYKEYRDLTGLDAPVIEFLKEKGQADSMLQIISPVIFSAVERYMESGYTNLMISFGCTGGHHRSVYSAQNMARMLYEKYKNLINIEVVHRELTAEGKLPLKPVILLAAGLGTRLAPLTDTCPKALVKVAGRTMLEWQLLKLKKQGFGPVVINVHHYAEQIKNYIAQNNNFGMEIIVSDESDKLLDTGGGIRQALHRLGTDNPVLVCNVDIFSTVDLNSFYNKFCLSRADVLLMTSERESNRAFCFDNNNALAGWINKINGQKKSIFPQFTDGLQFDANYTAKAFQGIHVIGPKVLKKLDDVVQDAFSITDFYINSASELVIESYAEPRGTGWVDAGKPESLPIAANLTSLY